MEKSLKTKLIVFGGLSLAGVEITMLTVFVGMI